MTFTRVETEHSSVKQINFYSKIFLFSNIVRQFAERILGKELHENQHKKKNPSFPYPITFNVRKSISCFRKRLVIQPNNKCACIGSQVFMELVSQPANNIYKEINERNSETTNRTRNEQCKEDRVGKIPPADRLSRKSRPGGINGRDFRDKRDFRDFRSVQFLNDTF